MRRHQRLEGTIPGDALCVPEVEDAEQRQQEQHLHRQALGRVPEVEPPQLVLQGLAVGLGDLGHERKQRAHAGILLQRGLEQFLLAYPLVQGGRFFGQRLADRVGVGIRLRLPGDGFEQGRVVGTLHALKLRAQLVRFPPEVDGLLQIAPETPVVANGLVGADDRRTQGVLPLAGVRLHRHVVAGVVVRNDLRKLAEAIGGVPVGIDRQTLAKRGNMLVGAGQLPGVTGEAVEDRDEDEKIEEDDDHQRRLAQRLVVQTGEALPELSQLFLHRAEHPGSTFCYSKNMQPQADRLAVLPCPVARAIAQPST